MVNQNLLKCIFELKDLEIEQNETISGYANYIGLKIPIARHVFIMFSKNKSNDLKKFFKNDEDYVKFIETCKIFIQKKNEILNKYNITIDEKFNLLKLIIDKCEKLDYNILVEIADTFAESVKIFNDRIAKQKYTKIIQIENKLNNKNVALIAYEISQYIIDNELFFDEAIKYIKNKKLKEILLIICKKS